MTLVDRLVYNAEILSIEGESNRLKEARERTEQCRKQRTARKAKPGGKLPRAPINKLPPFEIPNHWSAKEALAVYELLNDVAEQIWKRYDHQIIKLLRPELDRDDDEQLDLFGGVMEKPLLTFRVHENRYLRIE